MLSTSKKALIAIGSTTLLFSLAGCGTSASAAPHPPTAPAAATPLLQESAPATGSALPGAVNGPYSRVYESQNQPAAAWAKDFPNHWSHAYKNATHDAVFTVPKNAPAWMLKGVSWAYPEARAWPLSDANAYGTKVYGARSALPTITQFYGNATGVTAVNGVIYAESDDYFAYALNAKTGQLIWRASPVGNHLMGDPVVYDGIVYLSAGSVGFNFSQVISFAKNHKAVRGEHVSFNGIYALNAKTGKYLWHYGTTGETMPTPVAKNGYVYFGTGSGHVHCINAKTGQSVWDTYVGGIDNMSSPSVLNGHVYISMAVPGYLYCLNAKTGAVEWKATLPHAVNTGMGDVSPAVVGHIVVMDAVAYAKTVNDQQTVTTDIGAFNAQTGQSLWVHQMGRGPLPPAFKGGVPMIHDGIVYVGTPVNSIYQAYNVKTGQLLWTWHVPHPGPAGAGRGAATYDDGTLYIATGSNVYAL
ncbi:MAG: PQQ-binding-like beta-propeller repeat protein, partial [Firmicutes bacterium]|nr:PQQ-binding-like beta-propeller repeat protein [Bacillota bacterium]